MSDFRKILDIVEELSEDAGSVELHDSFDIELGEDLLIETGVVDITEDGVLVEGDEETLKLLAEHGVILEDTDWKALEKPTYLRKKSGEYKPADRTDYDVPAYQRKDKSKIMRGLEDASVEETMGDLTRALSGGARQTLPPERKPKPASAGIKAKLKSVFGIKNTKNDQVNELSPATKKSYAAAAQQDKAFNTRSIDNALQYSKEQPHRAADWEDEAEFLKSVNAKRDRGLKRAGVNEKMVMGLPGDQGSKVMGEGQADQEIKVYKINGKPVGEVGIDPEGSAGVGMYYMKHYASGKDLSGYDTREEAVAELKHCLKQGVAEGVKKIVANRKPSVEDKVAKHNAAVNRMTRRTFADFDYSHPDLLRTAPKGYRFDIRHILHQYQPHDELDEAEYHGRKVPLGKPMKGDVKKSKVYVRKPNGKVVKVNFGDKKMRIKKSNPKRRKSFRARHNCANPGPRWKARYWSCRAW